MFLLTESPRYNNFENVVSAESGWVGDSVVCDPTRVVLNSIRLVFKHLFNYKLCYVSFVEIMNIYIECYANKAMDSTLVCFLGRSNILCLR